MFFAFDFRADGDWLTSPVRVARSAICDVEFDENPLVWKVTMKGLIYQGDPLDRDGYVMTTTSTFFENGKRAALLGDLVHCRIDGHGVNPIVEADGTMFWDGKYLVVHGCRAACGCRVLSTRSATLIG